MEGSGRGDILIIFRYLLTTKYYCGICPEAQCVKSRHTSVGNQPPALNPGSSEHETEILTSDCVIARPRGQTIPPLLPLRMFTKKNTWVIMKYPYT